ncbi:MAG: hypothetical protein IT437_11945 [Phycisphaerales bacterium]|nr:hypothetical protein [Phycisphaerales bacterium]
MPASPGANLTTPPKLPTEKADIGHIAPSFDAPKRFNTLVIRADLRVSLRLGSLEDLFRNPPATETGRMERLQVLGLFYFPLGHARAREAFRGTPAQAGGTDPAPAFMGAWEYFKTRVMDNASDAEADAEIQRLLREWVVDRGTLPAPADDPANPAEDNFRKVRTPGGYTFCDSWQFPKGLNLNHDPRPAYSDSGLGTNLYKVESRFRTDNPILGKIPLVALVEKMDQETDTWKPLKDAEVYFQLVEPYALPNFDPNRSVVEQLNRPPIRDTTVGPPFPAAPVRPIAPAAMAGPMRTIHREENPTGGRAPAAGDPQTGNCPRDRGGLRNTGNQNDGTDVADVVFEIASRQGFNSSYPPASGRKALDHKPYPKAQNAGGGAHLHAVKAKTNDEGEAGVIFMPSRCGGDRYRIRAYVGPPTIAGAGSDGKGAQAVAAETGTLVNWRSLRVSRVIRQPISQPAAVLMAELTHANYAHLNTDPVNPATTPIGYLRLAYMIHPNNTARPPMPAIDFSFIFNPATQNHPPTAFDSFPVAFAKAFIEVVIDRTAQVSPPEALSAADWLAARQQARRDARVGQIQRGTRFDLDRLMHMEPGTTVDVNNAVVHLPMRTPEAYNASLSGGAPANQRHGTGNNTDANLAVLVNSFMIPGFLRRLTNNGFTPGLNIVTGGYGNSYSLVRTDIVSDSSGTSIEYRGGYVWAGAIFYATTVNTPPLPTASRPPWSGYSFTSNACHEIGHVMFRLHGPGNDPGMGAGGGNSAAVHDDRAVVQNQSICVMSYMTCEGDYCARCLLAFRGWDISTIPNP